MNKYIIKDLLLLVFKILVVLLVIINFYIGFHAKIQPFNICCGLLLIFQSLYYRLFEI